MRRPMNPQRNARLYLVLFVFALLVLTAIIAFVLFWFAEKLGLTRSLGLYSIMYLLAGSVIIGTLLAAVLAEVVIRPYRKLIAATREIAAGNFDARVSLKGPFEIEKLADSFNSMAKELGSIETLRGDFVSNVSHEFKTPVASIKGFAKLLKKDSLSPEARNEYLDIIIHESDRLTLLTSNVLLLSKIEGQNTPTDRTGFLLDEQLRQAVLMLEGAWQKKGLTIAMDLPPFPHTGEEELLMQVWINLLGNAVKFTPEGGSIAISLSREEGDAVVKIADTGIGMDAEVIQRIFDKFYQADASHSTKGNGLGLSLVKRIVEISQGHLTVESEPGQGTTVYVYLPEEAGEGA